MNVIYKSIVVSLALAGATATSGCVMRGEADNDRMDRHVSERDSAVVGVTVGFADIGYGYNDGFWDNSHRWHTWANDGQRTGYRTYQGNHYYDWNHDRDPDQGWHNGDVVVGLSVGFAEIGFGYSDGYWDNSHHWHHWANDGERTNYRSYQGNHYYDWNHDRDADDGWHTN